MSRPGCSPSSAGRSARSSSEADFCCRLDPEGVPTGEAIEALSQNKLMKTHKTSKGRQQRRTERDGSCA
ncbi:hypothetical protein MUK42_37803 [Musa troglodytarum]|uniref:Uncharacterized protein n=1 Tax=Musa troglodytarum TaxID=320322 RepID=A0A9E7JBY0_9LILI|nr:hypothetical protein MUK42_37803 [Musa troglodytarum]